MGDTVLVERRDGVATITLHRPERKNALDRQAFTELIEVCSEIAARPHDDRAVVLTGGDECFSSGADLAGRSADLHPLHGMRLAGRACLAVHQLPQPTIAKVRGPAVGAGLSLALACDLVVAGADARMNTMFTKRALSVDFGASWLLPRLVGVRRAKELVFFPDYLDVQEAYELGLVNRVLPNDAVDAFVDDWARQLATAPTIALSQSKRLLDDGLTTDLASAIEAEARAQVVNFGTADAKEAMAAFSERREPRYTGR